MKAIVITAPGRLEWLDWPTPSPGPRQVLVRTLACGICATDLIMIDGWERTSCPAIPGHEWSGVVAATGSAVDAACVGRRCVAENVLSDGGEIGFEHPGGYGEFLVTDAANIQFLPEALAPAEAALIEPLAVAVHGLRRLAPENRTAALIFGDGPIGLLLLMLLLREGTEDIWLVGGRPGRLELARELGARHTLNYHEATGDLAEWIRSHSDRPFRVAVEATGTPSAAQACVELADQQAKILIIGDYGRARAAFAWQRLLHGELQLIGSNASAGAWPEAVKLAAAGALPLHRLATHRSPTARFAEGIDLVRSRRPDVLKVVLEWGTSELDKP
jgi:2-desacetyl-2-hydroxyethyl bacteriochlorophyllide A dehydrogenase